MVVQKELDVRRLREENRSLREALGQRYDYPNIVAHSAKMQEVLALVERVAPTPSTVLLGGESGVGKDLIARADPPALQPRARARSSRSTAPPFPETLLESELFGYEKGAFTGATTSKPGKFELADKGTLFLDEIGDVPAGHAGEAPARPAGARVRAARRHANDEGGRAPDRRHQSRSARGARAGHLSRGPLLPAQRRAHRYSAAARAQGRHPRSGRICFSRASPRPRARASPGIAPEALRQADRVSLARQRARTGKHRRARLRPGPRARARSRRHSPRFRARATSHDSAAALLPEGKTLDQWEDEIIREAYRRANGNKSQAARLLGLSRNALRYRLEKIGIPDEPEKEAPSEVDSAPLHLSQVCLLRLRPSTGVGWLKTTTPGGDQPMALRIRLPQCSSLVP